MKPSLITTLLIPCSACFFSASAQEEPAPPLARPVPAAEGTYEGYPVLKASEVLKPRILKGKYHTVLESVPTHGFANQYTVRTKWGTTVVKSNHLLAKRIREFEAIAKLQEISASDEFQDAVVKAAAKPLNAVGKVLEDPEKAIRNIGSGAGRFLRRAGEAIQRKGAKSAGTGTTVESLIGYSKTKRELAHKLGVDVYSDNTVLQSWLNQVARASFSGGFVVRAGMLAITGGAGTAISAANMSEDLQGMLRDNDPLALSAINRKLLKGLKVSPAGIKAFLEHPRVTPSQQSALTLQLARLGPIPGIEEFLKMAGESEDAADVAFFIRTATMMSVYHTQVSAVKQIVNLHGLPAIYARDKSLVLPLAVDYGSWSPESDRLSKVIQAFKPRAEISRKLLYVSGIVSHRARKELEARGFTVADRSGVLVYKPDALQPAGAGKVDPGADR